MNQYENKKILGNWELHRLLGAGSYGRVYEIWQENGAFKAALKIISIPQDENDYRDAVKTFGSEEAAQKYFLEVKNKLLNEIIMLYKLQGNSNIVGYQNHAIVEHEEGFGWDIMIQMELLDTLNSYYGRKKQITSQDIIQLGMDVCKALEHCQKFDIVHRDIKPDNIMVSDTGCYKLGDFGVSCIMHNDRTRRMSKKGTEYYMAPELIFPDRDSDSRVDIYSLGIVMYKLLNANRYPLLPNYPAEYDIISAEDEAYIRRIKGEKLPAPLYAAGSRLGEIVLKACEADVNKRYFSPRDMYDDLAAIKLDEEDMIIYNVVTNGQSISYKPTLMQPRKADVVITGNHARYTFDNTERMATGFTTNADTRKIHISLVPGASAEVRAVEAGRYPMGLKPESFVVTSEDPTIRIGTVTVEDGYLEILPRKEKPAAKKPQPGAAAGTAEKAAPKSGKKGLMIGIGCAAVAVVVALIALLGGGKEDTEPVVGIQKHTPTEAPAVVETTGTTVVEATEAAATTGATEMTESDADLEVDDGVVRVKIYISPDGHLSYAKIKADQKKILKRLQVLSGDPDCGRILEDGTICGSVPIDRFGENVEIPFGETYSLDGIIRRILCERGDMRYYKRIPEKYETHYSDDPITRDMVNSIEVVQAGEIMKNYNMPTMIPNVDGGTDMVSEEQWGLKVSLTPEGVKTVDVLNEETNNEGNLTLGMYDMFHTTMFDAGNGVYYLLDNGWNLPSNRYLFETLKEVWTEEPLYGRYNYRFEVHPYAVWTDPAEDPCPGKYQVKIDTFKNGDENNIRMTYHEYMLDPVSDHDFQVKMNSLKARLDTIGMPYAIGLSTVHDQMIEVFTTVDKLSVNILEMLTSDWLMFDCSSNGYSYKNFNNNIKCYLDAEDCEVIHNEEDDTYALKVIFDNPAELREVTGAMSKVNDRTMMLVCEGAAILSADVNGYAQDNYLIFDGCPMFNLTKIDAAHRYVLDLTKQMLTEVNQKYRYNKPCTFFLMKYGGGAPDYEQVKFGQTVIHEKEQAVLDYVEENYPSAVAYYCEAENGIWLYVDLAINENLDFITQGLDQVEDIMTNAKVDDTAVSDALFYLTKETGRQRCRIAFDRPSNNIREMMTCEGLCAGGPMGGYADKMEEYALSKYFYQVRDFKMAEPVIIIE